ncbi:MAG: hypothetical protein OXC83_10830 [Chloroflexi bacterium]|nr:hypothetical protein [Chloroflexota bacterium]
MIRGRVNAELQPIISIDLRCQTGEFGRFEVKFDTGFNGELALPTAILENLKKSLADTQVTRFANGASETVNVYDIEVLIGGEIREMEALDLGSGSLLLGMKALPTWTGTVEFKVNGDVTIQESQ